MDRALVPRGVPSPAAAAAPAPAPADTSEEVRQAGDVTIVELRSDVLTADRTGNPDTLKRVVDEGARRIVVNLSRVEYVDSSGLSLLLSVYRRVRLAGGDLRVCCLQPKVKQTFALIRFDRILDVDPTEEAAVAALRGG
jgi:anti-sigma B factor antagonist